MTAQPRAFAPSDVRADCAALAALDEPESYHCGEDALMLALLRSLAAGRVSRPEECARIFLEQYDAYEGPRWYA